MSFLKNRYAKDCFLPAEEKLFIRAIMMHAANSESFSHLNIPVLKDEARIWVKGFIDEPINRIILYKYSRPPKKRAGFKGEIKAVYAIVFEVDADDPRVNMNSEEGARFLEKKLGDKPALFPGEKLLNATGQYQTVGDENQRAHFLTADFECVYKSPPSSDFREKWVFRVKFNNTPLDANIREERPSVILYQATKEEASSLSSKHKAASDQRARERCREVTRQILKENPSIDSVSSAINDGRITIAAKKPDGELYTEKTIRNWIKDLFPDHARRPGRRPKKRS